MRSHTLVIHCDLLGGTKRGLLCSCIVVKSRKKNIKREEKKKKRKKNLRICRFLGNALCLLPEHNRTCVVYTWRASVQGNELSDDEQLIVEKATVTSSCRIGYSRRIATLSEMQHPARIEPAVGKFSHRREYTLSHNCKEMSFCETHRRKSYLQLRHSEQEVIFACSC